ncbi:MAG: hypothetical protein ACLFN0_07230 [Thermovirgaceae bacterium]
MTDSERIDRKPPVEPLKVRNSLYDSKGRLQEVPSKRAPESAAQTAAILKALAGAFGRDLESRITENGISFFDETGDVTTICYDQAEVMVQNVHLTLDPLLFRKA